MDDLSLQIAADAAAAKDASPENAAAATAETSAGDSAARPETEGLSFGSMFGLAASWGKRVQAELQLGQLVDQAKKQSGEVSRAYSQDIAEFAQAVKSGATKSIDELSTRIGQLKTNAEEELSSDGRDGDVGGERADGPFAELRRRLQADGEKTRRLMSRVGADLEGFLREAIVIEAPGAHQTEQTIVYDRRMAQLAQLQESEDTYLDDPSTGAQAAEYAAFVESFKLDDRKDDVARLLGQDNLAPIHKRLVPDRVSDDDFWARYFFRAWAVEQEELRRKKLVDDAVAATAAEDLDWGSDGESDAEAPEKRSSSAAGPAQVDGANGSVSAPTAAPERTGSDDKKPEEGAQVAAPKPVGDEDWDEWE